MANHSDDDYSRNKRIIFDIDTTSGRYAFSSSIYDEIDIAENEIQNLNETINSVNKLTPECDRLDYILAISAGALSGVFDIFLVGAPGSSIVGEFLDSWFNSCTISFAKLCGCKKDSIKDAISFLEKKFKVPYDQTSFYGKAAGEVFGMNPKNHHFLSLAHNPTLLGLFYSILNQFTNTSTFVVDGRVVTLIDSGSDFYLQGKDLPSKLFCAFVNWLGHLISDTSGSSESQGRGMGIPSSLWSWVNDLAVLRSKLHIPTTEFDKSFLSIAEKIYMQGFDMRFQTAQTIPVIINDLTVRVIYSVRRLTKYFTNTNKDSRSLSEMWEACEPFSNYKVKRMLLVAHGTFCLIDAGDAVGHGFKEGGPNFNVVAFAMRLNIVGLGRFGISLYDEGKREFLVYRATNKADFARKEKTLIENYVIGLKEIAKKYDDNELMTFLDDLTESDLYVQGFEKSVKLATLRNVPEGKILKTKQDIDNYFLGGRS